MPNTVIDTIVDSKFALFPYNYLYLRDSSLYDSVINWFDIGQSNEMLVKIGLNSGSSIVNNYCLLCFIPLVICLHLVLILLVKLTEKLESYATCMCLLKFAKRIVTKLVLILTFGYYIRAMMEAFQFFLLCSISEINQFHTKSVASICSLVAAFALLAICLTFASVVAYRAFKTRDADQQQSKLDEAFSGVQPDRKHRLSVALLLARRIVFVSLLVCATAISPFVLTCVLCAMQLVYFVSVCVLRPFVEPKDNVIEVVNEVFVSVLLCLLTYLNTDDRWSPTLTNIYIYTLSANNFAILGIVLVATTKKLAKFCKEKCCNAPSSLCLPIIPSRVTYDPSEVNPSNLQLQMEENKSTTMEERKTPIPRSKPFTINVNMIS